MPPDSIKQYKNSPKGIANDNNKPYPSKYPASFRGGRGFSRGRGRFPVLNRTIIINNNIRQSDDFVSTVSTGSRKLINKKVYEKELQTGNLTKEQKIEALKLAKQKIRQKKLETRISKNQVRLDLVDRCAINGEIYAISRFGSKLVPLSAPVLLEEGGSVIRWNDHDYKRDKYGNLKLQHIKVFLKEQCRYFQKTGECSREATCRYFHNAHKVALCRNYMRGSCIKDGCKFSHEVNEHNVPHCSFFMKGACKNGDCQFLHTNPEFRLVCRPFAVGGYCLRGKSCQFTHNFECPDFQLSKSCPRGKNCKLAHLDYKDTTDAKIAFNTLNPSVFQLPDLTTSLDGNIDPRIKDEEVLEEDVYYDSDEDDNDVNMQQLESESSLEDALNSNKDFISF